MGTSIDLRNASSAIAERYRARIYGYILRLVRNRERADDLTQETFLRAHQRLGSLKDVGAVEAWLYRIATNLCYDSFRTTENRRRLLPLQPEGEEEHANESDETILRPDQLLERSEMPTASPDF